jgi:NADPH2:quinone reductase
MGRAVGFTEFGGPEVLHELDVEPAALGVGEVRIRVAAATVNPTDTYLRSGQYADALTRFDPPWIPGMEAAGVVVEVGQGVRTLAVGDQVLAVVTPMRPRGGAYTEVLVVPAGSVVPAPQGIPLTRSVTLAMNGLTAQRALDLLGLDKGAVLAVTGTTGMVGGLVARLAAGAGLEVRPVGRDPLPGDAEALVDAAAVGVASWVTVRPGGSVAALRPVQPDRSDVALHRVAVSDYMEEAMRLAPLLAAAERDELLVPEVIELDAADAVRAHRLMESGRTRPRPVLCF